MIYFQPPLMTLLRVPRGILSTGWRRGAPDVALRRSDWDRDWDQIWLEVLQEGGLLQHAESLATLWQFSGN